MGPPFLFGLVDGLKGGHLNQRKKEREKPASVGGGGERPLVSTRQGKPPDFSALRRAVEVSVVEESSKGLGKKGVYQ